MIKKWLAVAVSATLCTMVVHSGAFRDFTHTAIKTAQATIENNDSESLLPRIYVNSITVEKQDGNTVSGVMSVRNSEKRAIGNVRYELKVLSPMPAMEPNQLIDDNPIVYDRSMLPVSFSLNAGETRNIPFSYTSPDLPEASYRLRAQLLTTNDRESGWGDTDVKFAGAKGFAVIEPIGVRTKSTDPITGVTGTEWAPMEGPNVDAGQKVLLRTTMTNPTTYRMNGKIQISVRKFLSEQSKEVITTEDRLSFAANESKEVEIPLTTVNTPGAYVVLVTVINDKGERISGIGEYRYVVIGESASIAAETVASLPTDGGKNAKIHFVVAGSADRKTPVTGTVEMSIADTIGTINTAVSPLNIPNAFPVVGDATLTITRAICGTPTISITVKDSKGAELDAYKVPMPQHAGSCALGGILSNGSFMQLMLLLTACVILLLSRSLNTRWKSVPFALQIQSALTLALMAILFVGIFITVPKLVGANGIQHVALDNSDPNNHNEQARPQLFVNSPQHDSTITGNTVSYSARYSWISCGNHDTRGFLKVSERIQGDKVSSYQNVSDWRQLDVRTLFFRQNCHCDSRPTTSIDLAGTFTLQSLENKCSTTLWTEGNSQGSWRESIVYDYTWVNKQCQPPNFTIVKTGPATASPGNIINYDVTITNVGSMAQNNIRIFDTIPSGGLTWFPTGSTFGCSQVGGAMACTAQSFNPGQSQTVRLAFQLSQSAQCNSTIDNFAEGQQNSTTFVRSNHVQTLVQCPQFADLAITKTGPSSVLRGTQATYTLTVQHNGTNTATNVIVTDPIPNGFIFNAGASDNACIQNGNNVICTIPTMTAHSNRTFNITFDVPTIPNCQTTNVTNTATVRSDTTDPVPSNNTSQTITTQLTCPVVNTDVSIVKTGVASIVRGNNAVYNLLITNNGPATALNVTVTDPIPNGLTYQSASDSSCSLQGNSVICNLGTMNANATRSITLTFSTTATPNCTTTNVTNVATVSTTTTDTNSSNNTSQATTQITCPAPITGCIDVFKEGFDPNGTQLPYVPAFTFKVDGGVQTGTNDANGHLTFQNVPVGQHSVSEVMLSGWWQKLVTPSNGIVNVVAGSQCVGITFKNQQYPSSSSSSTPQFGCININKVTLDQNGNEITPTPQFQFISDDGGTAFNGPNGGARIDHVTPGAHSVEEIQQGGWNLVSVVPTGGRVVVPSNGLCATVTFTNRQATSSSSSSSSSQQYGCIDILKVAQNPSGGNISTVPAFTFYLDDNQVTSNLSNGKARFSNVPVGQHIVSEDIPNGWDQMQIQPVGGYLNVNAGQQLCSQITFINRQKTLSSSSSSSASPMTDVSITKTASITTIPLGTNTVFTIRVQNNGQNDAANVIMNDVLPSELTYVSHTTTVGTFSPTSGNWSIGTLQIGDSATLLLTARMNTASTVTNTANVTTTTQETNLNNNTASATVTGQQQAQFGCIDILKEAFNPTGGQISVVPAFTFKLDGTQPSTNDSAGRLHYSNVPVGTHTVTEDIPSGWTQLNVTPANGTVTVAAGNNCSSITFKNQQTATTSITDLSITKVANPTTVAVGATTQFTITVTNTGPSAATNTIVSDSIPTGLTYVSNTTTTGTYNSSNGQWTIGTMNAGATATMTIVTTMNATNSVTNIAVVSTATQESNYANNFASATVAGLQNQFGCIDIYKSAVDSNGNTIQNPPSFTFTLDGSRTATSDQNGRARFDTVQTGTHTVTENSLSNWTLLSITPSGTITVNSGNTCASVFVQNKQNSTGCTGNCCNGNCGGTASLTVSKDDGRSIVSPGDTLTYIITVRNNGTASANNATMTDALPDGLTAESASDGGNISGNFVRWNNISLGANATRTFTLTARVDEDAQGSLTNRVTINGVSDTDTDTVEANGNNGSVSITKSASTFEILPNGIVSYTVTIRNNGSSTLSNMNVTDVLPPGVSVLNNGGANGSSSPLTWNIGTLARGQERTLSYSINVGNHTAGEQLRNEACVTTSRGDRRCASAIVNIIGNLPQTGIFSANLFNGGNNSPFLHPIVKAKQSAPATSGSGLPAVIWVSLMGLAVGSAGGLAKKYFERL